MGRRYPLDGRWGKGRGRDNTHDQNAVIAESLIKYADEFGKIVGRGSLTNFFIEMVSSSDNIVAPRLILHERRAIDASNPSDPTRRQEVSAFENDQLSRSNSEILRPT
jgi:hypothetical protein